MRGIRDEKARRLMLEALGAGASVAEAARRAGVSRQAPYQWRDRGDDEMGAALEAAAARPGRGRRRAPRPAPDAATGVADPTGPADPTADPTDRALALTTLRGIVQDAEAPTAARVSAARALIVSTWARAPLAPAAAPAAPGPTPEGSRELLADARLFLRSLKGGAS